MAGRVVGVAGDITLPGFGLSPEDERFDHLAMTMTKTDTKTKTKTKM